MSEAQHLIDGAAAAVAAALREARIRQIRLTADVTCRVARSEAGRRLVEFMSVSRVLAPAMQAALGYRRIFGSLQEAEQSLVAYGNGGHVHPANADWHVTFAEAPRPSDYAALFHLRPDVDQIGRVFDLGGNLGNLYYCYARYLSFRPDLQWWVCDLPEHVEKGAELARQRGVAALRFTGDFADADGADLMIASGSLHYFATPLPEMLRGLTRPPRYILINRTPLTDGPTAATVQDAGEYRVACMLYNREALIGGLMEAGYQMVDAWDARELSLQVPGDPAHTVDAYSGMFFRRADTSPPRQ